MSFDTYTFAGFLAVVLILRRALPWSAGRVVMVAASYLFYGAGTPWHCLLLFASTLIDYGVSLRIHSAGSRGARRGFLALSLIGNLGLLAAFKYGGLAGDALPIGISFYTFQTLSYTIDVYQGKEKPTRDFIGFALYVSFFPQLVSGPIERVSRLLPQLAVKQAVSREDMEQGFQRVLWGLAKKLVVADRLGLFVDQVYGAPQDATPPAVIVATACFALQVYMDFSGYCDVAIGTARMMGIRLSENFRWPMLASNPVDFWSRWHITLGAWFRDYLFTALVGRRRPGVPRRILNILIVLLAMGVWHGAGWNFALFGLAAGIAVAAYEAAHILSGRSRARPLFGAGPLAAVAAVALTNVHLITLAFLFRSQSISHMGELLRRLGEGPWVPAQEVAVYAACALVLWALCVARGRYNGEERRPLRMPAPLRAVFWTGLVVALLYGAVDTSQQFIYFQF